MKTTTEWVELDADRVLLITKTEMTKFELKVFSDVFSPSKEIVSHAELTGGVFQESKEIKRAKKMISEASNLNLMEG